MKKKPVLMFDYALTGIGYGIPATIICMILIGGYREPIGEFAIWTVASALLGLLSGAIFNSCSEKLTLPAALLIHCVSCLAIAVGASYLCGYDEDPFRVLMAVLPVFIIVYAITYGVIYFRIRLEEKRINQALDQEN